MNLLSTYDRFAIEPWRHDRAATDPGSSFPVYANGSDDVRVDVRQDDRARYSRLQAARHGDRQAFADVCAEMRGPLSRRVQRQLTSEGRDVTASAIEDLVERVFLAAFEEMPEKPDNWSTYGWMTWLVEREIAAGEGSSGHTCRS